MRKWIAPAVVVALILILFFWIAWPSAPDRTPERTPEPVVQVDVEEPKEIAPTPVRVAVDAGGKPAPKPKLVKTTQEFYDKVDTEIPRKLYARAADCYHVRLDKDQKIKFLLKLRSINGEIQVVDAKIAVNNVTDEKTANCIIQAIKTAGWFDEEMPDWEDEDELLVRMGALKKYMPEDWEPEEVPYTGPDEDPEPIGEGSPPSAKKADEAEPAE